ncbi:MAG: asparagine synthase (glutamine-hydrolyzing) [Acidobacteria bacterium]|nr:asparagine synthase (glutamine-hydrolyzing) [Acidobacteriota bacterium]
MCGIAGLIAPPGGAVAPRALAAMAAALAHRGPDDEGYAGWDGQGPTARPGGTADVARGSRVGLAHRRLAILDLSDAGHQPMITADGRFALLFNGEIYNFRELRQELEQDGERFASRCDTEVLLAALARWGTGALARLVGMFAFALLDTRRRTLLLARDFFGIKPLYYARGPWGFAFASEIKALLAIDGFARRADPRPLFQYLRFGITDHGEDTLFSGIRRLPPAHLLELPLDESAPVEPRRYWKLSAVRGRDISFEEAARRLRELFLDSVSLHLRSDVPVGAALSGGVDSSAIVAAMRAALGPDLDLHAVSYLAGDPAIDEERWAALAAGAACARVHHARPGAAELVRDIERIIEVQDEPFGSTSIYAQYRVFRAAKEAGIKVMLDGQGADETFAGYRSYVGARIVSLARAGDLPGAVALFRAGARLPGASARQVLSSMAGRVLPPGLVPAARRLAGRPLFPRWVDEAWLDERGPMPDFPRPTPSSDALRSLLAFTIEESSLPMLLRFEDRNSMAFSIESRVPFLTPQLVGFVLSLPEEHLVANDATTKAVLRAALRGLVPDPILDRRDKIGFATPELQWLRQIAPWVRETISCPAARSIPVLRIDAAAREFEEILDGRRPFDWRVWRWINIVRWTERFGVTY